MIQLNITMTGKGYSSKDQWSNLGEDRKTFSSIQEAKAWIKDQYGKAKRMPMYVYLKDGGSKRIGYVIGFRNADFSHYPVNHWIQQDWIQFNEVNTVTP